jgi:hypothetical protein
MFTLTMSVKDDYKIVHLLIKYHEDLHTLDRNLFWLDIVTQEKYVMT